MKYYIVRITDEWYKMLYCYIDNGSIITIFKNEASAFDTIQEARDASSQINTPARFHIMNDEELEVAYMMLS